MTAPNPLESISGFETLGFLTPFHIRIILKQDYSTLSGINTQCPKYLRADLSCLGIMTQVIINDLVVFTAGKCRYGRQEILFSLALLYPRRSKTQGGLFVQKAEKRLACSRSAKQDSSTQALNLFHIVSYHSPAPVVLQNI